MPIEEQRLLWAAIVWVSLKYHSGTDAEKKKRPQCTYQADDGKVLGRLIKTIRRNYAVDQLDERSAQFQTIKAKVLQTARDDGLTLEKRNYYSSVIATFFSWLYHGTPASRATIINLVASFPPPPGNPNQKKED
jgi:hypothetical protein